MLIYTCIHIHVYIYIYIERERERDREREIMCTIVRSAPREAGRYACRKQNSSANIASMHMKPTNCLLLTTCSMDVRPGALPKSLEYQIGNDHVQDTHPMPRPGIEPGIFRS